MKSLLTAGAARSAPAVFFLALAVLGGCAASDGGPATRVFSGPTMGTTYTVKVVAAQLAPEREEAIATAIVRQLAGVNDRMSTYLEDSELSRFNRHRDGSPFAVSAETAEVFASALEVSALTGGAFDVTVGPLVNAWGFGPGGGAQRAPTAEEIAALGERIGYGKLAVDEAAGALRKSHPDLYCDLSAIAKGYAVDRVAAALADLGVGDFMVEVGGEVAAAGRNAEGRSWRIGIERPQLVRGSVQRIVALDRRALATSGDYRNYREHAGVRYSHIIDPRRGRPIQHRLASVSVVDERCMVADALATGLLVLGPDEGFELAVRENLAVLFLIREGSGFAERATPAFEELAGGRP